MSSVKSVCFQDNYRSPKKNVVAEFFHLSDDSVITEWTQFPSDKNLAGSWSNIAHF